MYCSSNKEEPERIEKLGRLNTFHFAATSLFLGTLRGASDGKSNLLR